MTEMVSLVLFAAYPTATAAFYRCLGLDLENEHHGEGPEHYATRRHAGRSGRARIRRQPDRAERVLTWPPVTSGDSGRLSRSPG
jgi:hypothetical protein